MNWSYRASRTNGWFLPCSISWVQGLLEVAHSMTEDPKDRGYRPTRLWGQWQLQSVSISNGDGRWPVGPLGVKGQGRAMQRRSNKQKARAYRMGATQQPSNKAARMRRSKSWPRLGVYSCCPLAVHPLGACASRKWQRMCTSPKTHSQGFWGAPASPIPQPASPPCPHRSGLMYFKPTSGSP